MELPTCTTVNPYELMYAHYRPMVYGTALRVLGDPSEAEDIVQTIFLRIYARPGFFRGGNLAGWLTAVAKNCAIDRVRRKTRERLHGERETSPFIEDVADQALKRLERDWIRHALLDLSDIQRRLLYQIYYDGSSHRSIAREAGIPLGTVKTRVRSSLSRLRRAALAASPCA